MPTGNRARPDGATAPTDLSDHERRLAGHVMVYVFTAVPALALVAAVPLAWGWGLSILDAGLALAFYLISISASRSASTATSPTRVPRPAGMRIALAVAGSLAVQGPILHWVADHRRHHAFSDKEGDPHSPWLFGTLAGRAGPRASGTPTWAGCSTASDQPRRFAPDLLADRDIAAVDRLFPLLDRRSACSRPAAARRADHLVVVGRVHRVLLGGPGAGRAAAPRHLVDQLDLPHGRRARRSRPRDRSTNVWPLAVLSMGESWHNLHHADPTCARHGVRRGQIDMSARVIWLFEKLGWATDVRWPTPERLARLARA